MAVFQETSGMPNIEPVNGVRESIAPVVMKAHPVVAAPLVLDPKGKLRFATDSTQAPILGEGPDETVFSPT